MINKNVIKKKYIYNKKQIYNRAENEELSYINIIYDVKQKDNKEINIFGYEFVKNNKNKCKKMIIDNKEYELAYQYNIEIIIIIN